MSSNDVPFPFYPDLQGKPLQNGQIFFGTGGANPVTSPVAVYWDSAMTQPALQPLTVSNGMVSHNGAPARVWVSGDYSRLVRDSLGRTVLYEPSVFPLSGPAGAALIGYGQRTVGAKLDDLLCIDDKGADPLGIAGSAAAIEAAWAAVKSGAVPKKGIYGRGKYRIERPVVLAGDDDLDASLDHGTVAEIHIATITPDPGIGVAITIHTLRRPQVFLSFANGGNGSEADVGVEWYDVEAMAFKVYGSNYNGLLCKFDGNKGRWIENGDGVVWARKCYKALDWSGASPASHNSGTGRVSSVWDILPTRGAVIQNMDDVTVEHYENAIFAATFTGTVSLSVSNNSSMHFGIVALGKEATNLMIVNGNTNIHIDNLYTFGGNASGAGTSNGLLAYNNALFSIDEFTASGNIRGLWCDGNNNLEVGMFQGLNCTNDVAIEKVNGASFNVNLAFARYFSQSAFNESLKVVAGGITGTLTINGGRVRSGNVSTLAAAGVDTSVSSGTLFTRCDDLEVDASWATSVKTISRLKFAGFGNNFLGATPVIDATGRKGSLDGRTWLIDVPALAVATTYQNANPYPVALWVPMRFEAGALATDFGTLKLIDYEGITHDLVDTQYTGVAPTSAKFFTLRALVPAGWSYRIEVSNPATVTFQGTPRSIRI